MRTSIISTCLMFLRQRSKTGCNLYYPSTSALGYCQRCGYASEPSDKDQPLINQTKAGSITIEKTPKGRLDDAVKREGERHRDAEKEPLPRWTNDENPNTGEKGGPAGPEPTRFGDWERKGRVSDF